MNARSGIPTVRDRAQTAADLVLRPIFEADFDDVFFPGIAFPLLLFAALYAFPFVAEFLSRDPHPHNVLRLLYQQPFITALGSAVFAFLLVLFFAGSDDVIAVAVGGSVVAIRTLLCLLVFVVPAVTGVVVFAACAIVRRRRTPMEWPRARSSASPRRQ